MDGYGLAIAVPHVMYGACHCEEGDSRRSNLQIILLKYAIFTLGLINMDTKRNTPIYNMLMNYSGTHPLPFHMPGHVMGRGLADLFTEIGSLDITEIPGSDCLHDPDGVIRMAQELAARAFGARTTHFSVNGSTVGIHAMIRAAVKPGGKILINRDAHRAAFNAIALLKAEPVFLMPEYDPTTRLTLGFREADLRSALSEHPDIEAILLTRPNYYGAAFHIRSMIGIARSVGIPFLVDEAHGAHFAFSDLLPEPALRLGADACVQSLHKTLPAMTQTALVHEGPSSLLEPGRLFRCLSMLQTTSPSYVLMASMDIARDIMEREGAQLYEALYRRIQAFERELEDMGGVRRVVPEAPGLENDFSRIVLSFGPCGLTGFQAERILRESSGIVAEMADEDHVVLIATPFHSDADFENLLAGIREAVRYGEGPQDDRLSVVKAPEGLPERAMNPGDAIDRPAEAVELARAVGRISASAVTPYPPGIPLIMPGEVFSAELVRYLTEIQGSGGRVHGIMEGRVLVIRQAKEN